MAIMIAFLRGINMTGHNMINMADLTALFRKLGFKNAETYIQSGNVIFTNPDNQVGTDLELLIEKAIKKKFGHSISVMIRSAEEIKKVLQVNPFIQSEDIDPTKHSALFLKEVPAKAQTDKIAGIDYPPDKFCISGREIFIWCPNGFGKTKLYTNFFENKMKIIGTARNWKTIRTLVEISEKQ
jgi:uncharacterized protein (DUF1697 family)